MTPAESDNAVADATNVDTATENPVGTDSSTGASNVVTRREMLAALGGASILASPAESTTDLGESDVHVRVYPGRLPTYAWARYGWRGARSGWAPPHEAAYNAVESALEQFDRYRTARGRLDGVDITVERGGRIDLTRHAISAPRELVSPTQQQILDAFRTVLHDRGEITGSCCHLLLWWGPLHHDVGYGGTRSPNSHVAKIDGEGAQTVANIGATELWDSRAVTKNMAIHETLHTYLSSRVANDVVGSACDHDLGTAIRTDDHTLEVSPIATAYAGPEEMGAGTRFHGTGCHDHGSFARHDGLDGIERFNYTTTLSEATLEGMTRYLEATLE
ncbi:hypothetical protein OB919_07150 [Halobacteria archaeon AArc-curdl1]|uniref:Uncharacterized protein n=1 Tax=Natronosalvus hydrolyticus TaxID=2979988 RepID=A0AAP2Z7L2_9EURY|nr:hypothetical protein [Halobacteria archaeon AArc-curdl1]